jgi:hypothetical protein
MAHIDWRLKGKWLKSCNCAFGCPCDFNALPTHGHCEGMVGMEIDQGHFGEVKLDGLRWAITLYFPGALHEGNGTVQPVIDERANDKQRQALLTILSGQEQAEGTLFHIFSLIVSKMHEPLFLPIEFEFDLDGRTARVAIPGVLDSSTRPILNPVTGQPHRIRVVMPEGFEHHEGEVASASLKGTGKIEFDIAQGHSTLARVEHTPSGLA